MRNESRFWNWIAKMYSKQAIADEPAYQKKLDVTREYLSANMQVLEFGCGTGSTAIIQAPYVKHIHAIDFSAKMIEIANAKAQVENINNITFEQLTIEALETQDASLDAVFGFSILHLLGNKEDAIGKVYKMLKPGGVFVSSTSCLGESFNPVSYLLRVGYFLGVLPNVRNFSIRALEACFVQAGFEVEHKWHPGKDKAVFFVVKKPD